MTTATNVVLVYGGFVDGSGWQAVYDLLKQDGFNVDVVQDPTVSLEGDVATTNHVLDAQDGPVVLVGHSYGGAVITEAGNHESVVALVYIAAFAPDKGESVDTRRLGHEQQGDRRAPVPLTSNGEHAPVPDLPETRNHFACRAPRRSRAPRHRHLASGRVTRATGHV
jgi:pimeloyl-ACP methyl ester carboxylesterase